MSEIQSLARGLKILDVLNSRVDEEITVGEVAKILDVNKSSASRLLKTLAAYDYVKKNSDSRSYSLGNKMQVSIDLARDNLRERARPFIYQLMQLSGECSHTAIYANRQALIIDDVEPESSLKVSGRVGRSEELHSTAVGKCLLAFMGIDCPNDLSTKTDKTITNSAEFKAHIEMVVSKGYAYDDEENSEGVRCLAAPVYNANSKVIACIGISGPTVRLTDEKIESLAELTVQSAWELSQNLANKTVKRRRLI